MIVTDAAAVSAIGETPSPSPSDPNAPPLESTPSVSPTDASDLNYVTPALFDTFTNFDCSTIDALGLNVAPTDQPLVTCDNAGTSKFILGPVEIAGENISNANAALVPNSQGAVTNVWGVNLEFDGTGSTQFAEVTTRLNALTGAQNQFAIVLDGRVITAPATNNIITDGKAQITGSFTQDTSKALADQLKFGALPIGFEVQSSDVISATLGDSQLQGGLLAGLIGLILVVVYSIFQYRMLGMVTVFSLIIAAGITYLVVTYLSSNEGYRLSLAGVAGLIVAIGITADSFIVYFERIRDELRDGRALGSAIEAGWKRALRTIIASDAVNFLAAAILFILAVGNVRGFALTLGITTIVDLIVVSLFTHPLLQLVGRSKFFSEGHRASGLDPRALGAVYRGRATFRTPTAAPGKQAAGSSREAAKRQTIAERKSAEGARTGTTTATRPSTKGKDS